MSYLTYNVRFFKKKYVGRISRGGGVPFFSNTKQRPLIKGRGRGVLDPLEHSPGYAPDLSGTGNHI